MISLGKKTCVALLAAGTIGFATASPADADIIITAGVNNQGTDNVLLTDATNVPIVTGTVNSGLFDVKFISSGGNLDADASGQAVVDAATGNDPFTNIAFYLEAATFTRAVFNLNTVQDGFIRLTATGINILGNIFQTVLVVDGQGQNFFTVDADGGSRIQKIDLQALNVLNSTDLLVFQDLRQVRIGGVAAVPVPEPVELLLLGMGFAAVATVRRWRDRRA